MPWLAVVLVFLLGCRENREEEACREDSKEEVEDGADGGERIGLEHGELEEECGRSYATGVVIAAAPDRGRLALAKRDETMEESARLEALAWHQDGDGDPEEAFASFEWEIADEGVAYLLSYGAYSQGAMLWARADRFDSGGEDPETTVTVCVRNDCGRACGQCEERICSEPLTVVGVPNLEGRWQIVADTLPVPVAVDVRQDGTRLVSGIADAEAWIEGDRVQFIFRDQIYTGALSEDRGLVEGTVAWLDDDSVHLSWSAARLDGW